jgi:ADP-ribose pyrophosphatase YjhB (NUDIX family)
MPLSPVLEEASSIDVPLPALRRWFRRLVTRLFHLWFLVTRPATLGVRALVLDGAGRVFLVRHTYVSGWFLPGGGVETGQDAQAALAMELSEEGNIALTGEPVLFGIYHNAQASRRDHVLLYIVRAFCQRGPRPPDREIAEAGFFPLDALPAGTTPATRARLAEVLHGVPPARCW